MIDDSYEERLNKDSNLEITKLMEDWAEVREIVNDPEEVSGEFLLIPSHFPVGSPNK